MSTAAAITEKRCRGCGTVKPAIEFWRNRSKPDGIQDYCKPCLGEKVKRSIERRGAPYPDYRNAGQPARPHGPVSPIIDGMKACRKCGTTKPVSEFYRSASVPGGFQYWCKACQCAPRAQRPKQSHLERGAGKRIRERVREMRDNPSLPTKQHTQEDSPCGDRTDRGQTPSGGCGQERVTTAAPAVRPDQPVADAAVLFVCERGASRTHCACGVRTRLRCGFPSQGSTCSEPLCVECAHEIRPRLLYCNAHWERAQEALAAHRRRMEGRS